jgi:hypothetical protein
VAGLEGSEFVSFIAQPTQTVPAAELLAKLAKYEQIAREGLARAGDQEQRAGLQGEIAGLGRAARLTRELAGWPVEADSERT